jgi:hypothetical protein
LRQAGVISYTQYADVLNGADQSREAYGQASQDIYRSGPGLLSATDTKLRLHYDLCTSHAQEAAGLSVTGSSTLPIAGRSARTAFTWARSISVCADRVSPWRQPGTFVWMRSDVAYAA